MRRVGGIVLAILGLVLVVAAPVLKWGLASTLVKVPLDINRTTIAEADSQVLVLAAQRVQAVHVVATRTVTGDSKAGTANVAVYDEVLCLRASKGAGDNAAGCPVATDPTFIQRTTDRIAFGRRSGLAVANGSRFGANVNGDKSIVHEGLGYTFPIATKKTTYPFFDTVLGKAYPMSYQDTEKLDGLTVYKFGQNVPASPIKIQGLIPGTYSNVRTVWVEPTTGVIVKGSEKIEQKFAQGGTIAFSGTLVFNDATVKSQANYAKSQMDKINLVRWWIPLGLLVLGLLAIVGGLLLARGRRSDDGELADVDRGAGQDRAPQR